MCKPFFAFLCKMYSKFMFFELRKPYLDVFFTIASRADGDSIRQEL